MHVNTDARKEGTVKLSVHEKAVLQKAINLSEKIVEHGGRALAITASKTSDQLRELMVAVEEAASPAITEAELKG